MLSPSVGTDASVISSVNPQRGPEHLASIWPISDVSPSYEQSLLKSKENDGIVSIAFSNYHPYKYIYLHFSILPFSRNTLTLNLIKEV